MTRRLLLLAFFLVAILATPARHLSAREGPEATPTRAAQPAAVAGAPVASVDPAYLKLLRWRMVGPSRGGRVVAVAGDPVDKLTFYQGSTGGGVWKTDDGGLNWHNISDGFFNTGSVGAIAVAPSNTSIVYVGMGEACIRGNASYGDGVYRSNDGGKTWTHLGLEATRQIARVRVNPTNPDLVYVAALGDPWGPSPTAASIAAGTAGARGKRCSSAATTPARSIWSWTRRTRTCCMRRRSSCGATRGASAARARARRSTRRPTAGRRGPS